MDSKFINVLLFKRNNFNIKKINAFNDFISNIIVKLL